MDLILHHTYLIKKNNLITNNQIADVNISLIKTTGKKPSKKSNKR